LSEVKERDIIQGNCIDNVSINEAKTTNVTKSYNNIQNSEQRKYQSGKKSNQSKNSYGGGRRVDCKRNIFRNLQDDFEVDIAPAAQYVNFNVKKGGSRPRKNQNFPMPVIVEEREISSTVNRRILNNSKTRNKSG